MSDEHCTAKLCEPRETCHLLLDSGDYKAFDLYFNPVKKKYLVKCDLCTQFLVLDAHKSTLKLAKHRGQTRDCKKEMWKQEKAHMSPFELYSKQNLLKDDSPSDPESVTLLQSAVDLSHQEIRDTGGWNEG
ncbi:hypothetical protein CPB84DRAFT_1796488 [Gymnopilus junonius]|uniref:Uncharacterized protein n=1 Tax=Gymnopilus junonius TaxID=109634 RepID=A0A9P5NBS5_GYMJU|nr:hypothetical protein CPB84DRAFT_1796488 [Gymnopilus junonius]